MIPAGVQVFLARDPVDLRLGFDRLAGLVRDRFDVDPRGGALFVFLGRRRTALKILFFDGSGLCLFCKRLDRGVFQPPAVPPDQAHVELDDAVLETLLDGLALEPQAPDARPSRRRLH